MNKIAIASLITLSWLLLLAFLLGWFNEEPKPVLRYDFKFERFVGNISIKEDPNLPTLGKHQEVGGMHFITLRKYPICLLHEIRHATEGDWHKGRESDEDCYQH